MRQATGIQAATEYEASPGLFPDILDRYADDYRNSGNAQHLRTHRMWSIGDMLFRRLKSGEDDMRSVRVFWDAPGTHYLADNETLDTEPRWTVEVYHWINHFEGEGKKQKLVQRYLCRQKRFTRRADAVAFVERLVRAMECVRRWKQVADQEASHA